METQTETPRQILAVHHEGDETPTIAALAAALAKAQGQMKAAAKDSKNPHFGSKYADFASIVDAIRGPLSANGLAFIQRVSTTDGVATVTTRLMHSSGEWIQDKCSFPVAQKTPQGYGSAITYAKRYALSALVGVAADEDDDGNAASGRQEPQRAPKTEKREARADEAPAKTADDAHKKLRAARLRKVWERAQYMNMDKDTFRAWAKDLLKVDVPSIEWTDEQLGHLEAALERMEKSAESEADVPH